MLDGKPIIVGEVLFDVFPQGESVLGGAPFNVAWHLQGFGLQPVMITAIGDDERGRQVLNIMKSWGMDLSGVQIDRQHPTGQVSVSLAEGIPSYEILSEQAYDFIETTTSINVLSQTEPALLCHGSLVARTDASRRMIENLLSQYRLPAFVDINLRDPWWSHETVEAMLQKARWVKLNEDELSIIMHEKQDERDGLKQLAQRCLKHFNLELLVVTLGEQGAFCTTRNEMIDSEPVRVDNMVDTVGAGDSFTAVMITGLLAGWPLATALPRALQFSAAICGIRGATTDNRDLYDRFLAQW